MDTAKIFFTIESCAFVCALYSIGYAYPNISNVYVFLIRSDFVRDGLKKHLHFGYEYPRILDTTSRDIGQARGRAAYIGQARMRAVHIEQARPARARCVYWGGVQARCV